MRVCWLRQFAVAGMTVVLALGIVASRAVAKDADPGPGADGGANKDTGKGKVDPAASAFKLPSGVTLNAKQRAAYDDLKAAKEQELRDAIEDAKNAHSGAATAQAVKKVKECRAEIRKAIDDILNGTAPGTGTPNQAGNGSGPESSGSTYTTQYGGYGPSYPGYYPFGYSPYGYNPYGYNPYGNYPYHHYPYRPNSGKGTQGSSTSSSGNSPPVNRSTNRPSPPPPRKK